MLKKAATCSLPDGSKIIYNLPQRLVTKTRKTVNFSETREKDAPQQE